MTADITYAAENADYLFAGLAAIGFTCLYLFEKNFVLKPLGVGFFGIQERSRSLAKFCDAAFKLQIWASLSVLGLFVCMAQPWFFDWPRLWSHFPNPMTWWIRFYYLVELGWYGHAQFSLMVLEDDTGKKRSDFIPMTIHHLTTISLISFSYLQGYSPVGCAIMLVHDVVDVPLEAALASKEIATGRFKGAQKLCDALFVVFVVAWLVFRLGIFPFQLVRSVERDIMVNCPLRPGESRTQMTLLDTVFLPRDQVPTQCPWVFTFFCLLSILVVLHVYWFWLILRMVYRAIFAKTVAGDIRDEDVGDDDVGDEAKAAARAEDSKASAKTSSKGSEIRHRTRD